MQRVERRNHRNRKHRKLISLVLCVLLAAGSVTAALLLRKKAEEVPPEARKRVTGAITNRLQEDLVSITLTRRGGETWTVIRDEDGELRLEEDGEETGSWVVDSSISYMLQDAAANLTFDDVFTENREDWAPHAEDFGLEDPLVTAVIRFRDGKEVTARIGDSAEPDNNAYYYMAVDGDDRLFAVASGTVQDLNIEKNLLHPVKQPEIRSVLLDRITVRDAEGKKKTEWVLQGRIDDRDAAENWLITAPFAYPADYESMSNLRESAEKIRMGTYAGKADEESLARFGLDRPSAVIELHMARGSTGTVGMGGVYDVTEWPERTVTIAVGERKGEMTDYVLFGEEIYTLSHFSVSPFTDTDPLTMAARYPVATPLNSLESLLVEEEGKEPVLYSIVRAEQDETAGGAETGGETSVRCLRNGKEIAWSAFSAAYERLLTVTVSGKLPEGWTEKESDKKYTLRTISGGTHTVALSDYDGMHDAVSMDGHTLFYLIKDGMTELP